MENIMVECFIWYSEVKSVVVTFRGLFDRISVRGCMANPNTLEGRQNISQGKVTVNPVPAEVFSMRGVSSQHDSHHSVFGYYKCTVRIVGNVRGCCSPLLLYSQC